MTSNYLIIKHERSGWRRMTRTYFTSHTCQYMYFEIELAHRKVLTPELILKYRWPYNLIQKYMITSFDYYFNFN